MSQESEQMDALIAAVERCALALEQNARSAGEQTDTLVMAVAKLNEVVVELNAIKEKMPVGI